MFLEKKFILANELVEKMDIHIANISMLRQQFEDNDDFYSIVKMNNCSFINTRARNLPNNIRVGIYSNTFTDMSDKLPCTWVKSEYDVTERELFKSGIVVDKIKISGKQLYVFNKEFVNTMKHKIGYVLDAKECQECHRNGQIDGFIELGKNKFFTWY